VARIGSCTGTDLVDGIPDLEPGDTVTVTIIGAPFLTGVAQSDCHHSPPHHHNRR
jgi:hypothetical protein